MFLALDYHTIILWWIPSCFIEKPIVRRGFQSYPLAVDLSSHVCLSNTSHVLSWFSVWFSKQRLKFVKCCLVLSSKMVEELSFVTWVRLSFLNWVGESSSSSHVYVTQILCDFPKHWLKFAKVDPVPSSKYYPFLKFFHCVHIYHQF